MFDERLSQNIQKAVSAEPRQLFCEKTLFCVMHPFIYVENLNFNYLNSSLVLDDISFEANEGKIISILGESGSGKSTLLKLIYGLEDATSGKIYCKNREVTGPKFNLVPGHEAMKFVPQEFDLMDSIRVEENVGKYLSNFNLKAKKEDVKEALETVYMHEFSEVIASKLSGGQRQRVSIARALAAKPEVLLLDEPYSHLDQPLKIKVRKNIWQWAKANQITVFLTTHDYNDALGYSDEIIVLKNGKMIQMDPPEVLRNQPKTQYVASLLGQFNTLDSKEMFNAFQLEINKNQKAIIYPEEIEIDPKGVEVEITDIRYRGEGFTIHAIRNQVEVLFYSDVKPTSNRIQIQIKNFRTIEN